jgi:lipid II:glycine glycyltransferase (peptidoglycan interpeptide bridge formation enzyme)
MGSPEETILRRTGSGDRGSREYLKDVIPSDLARCNEAASFLQSGFWGSFKARFGWNARSFLVDWGERGLKPLLVIRRRLGPGISFAYVPWGPELPQDFPPEARNQALTELARSVYPFLPGNTAFIRFDPPWYTEGPENFPTAPEKPFVRAGADIQPPDTVLLDLSSPAETILMGMKPKWRYNIKLAEKKKVVIRRCGEEGLDVFYGLLRETARRDGIAVHGIDYYRTLFIHTREYAETRGGLLPGLELRLYLAEHGGELLAGIITLFRGKAGVYLYGASSSRRRNLMAPYALQWRAIKDAKAAGCLEYDLFGIPPNNDPSHPMAGLYRFKTGFGGRIIHRPGSWDYAYKPLTAGLFRALEQARKSWRNLKKGRPS